MLNRIVLLFALAVAFGLIGCGGGDYSSPKATYETMIAAAKAEDKDALMNCFTRETQADMKEIEKLSEEMGAGMDKNQDVAEQFKDAEPVIGEEKIDGDKATLEVTLNGTKQDMPFVKEGGEWKMSIPELKMGLEMMKKMPDMMKDMSKGMGKEMQEMMKGMQEGDKK